MLTCHTVDTLIVSGMVMSGRVRATAADAFSHDDRVIVPREMEMITADVLPLDAVVGNLRSAAAR